MDIKQFLSSNWYNFLIIAFALFMIGFLKIRKNKFFIAQFGWKGYIHTYLFLDIVIDILVILAIIGMVQRFF